MTRVARIYVTRGQTLTPGIRTLLATNQIPYLEIDISDDADAQRLGAQQAGISDWPVIELDGKFAAGGNIVALSRTLALELSARPGPPTGCC
jgi:hypothetical protein